MAATYDPTQPTAKDRVRRMIADVAARFDFQDEEIGASLTDNGFVGDPLASSPKQPIPELQASIALIESLPSASSSGDSVTIKTLNISRTNASGVKDRSGILVSLRRRLNGLLALSSGDNGGPVVVDGYPDPCCGRWL